MVAIDLHWNGIEDWKATLDVRDDALALTADVTNDADLDTAYEATLKRFGTVDVICNNAGYRQRDVTPTAATHVLDIPLEHWQRMIDVNITAPWKVTRHFIAPMLEKKSGSIVNTGSFGGDRGRPGDQPYGMSKAAFTNWVQSLAEELKPYNIACNIFSPEGTKTTGWADIRAARAQAGIEPSPPSVSRSIQSAPLKPESCVPLVLFLAQQDAKVTGYYINHVLEWNKLHGLGGEEVWAAQVD